jgi:hypothetical protein
MIERFARFRAKHRNLLEDHVFFLAMDVVEDDAIAYRASGRGFKEGFSESRRTIAHYANEYSRP